jgi:UDP-N-acetylglucosamine 3-dehydrogenase
MRKILRAGVIGVGSMGKNHARIYNQLRDVELVGVADVRPEMASQIAQQHNTKAFTDYRDLLGQQLDVVSIVVPTSQHVEVTLAAAEAGTNVLVEKPIADNLAAAHAMIDRCQKCGVKLMVGHVERFNPVLPVIKDRISSLNVISINISRLGPIPPRIRDVGVVIDLATHDIDILRFLTGSEFRKVQSMIGSGLIDDREDTALLSFEMENGILCHINTNWLTPFKLREINVASKEKFVKGWLVEQRVSEFQSNGDGSYTVRDVSVPYGEPLENELSAFTDSVRNGEPLPVTGMDGLKALETALLCLKRAE